MRLERWAWLLLLLAVPSLAMACGDDGTEPPMLAIPKEELPRATAATADEELLASMVLSAEEVGEVFPEGVEWMVFSVPQESTPDEEPPLGQVTGWLAVYNPEVTSEVFEVSTLLLLYQTAEDASRGFVEQARLDLETGPGVEITEFDAGEIGDEARGQVNRTPEVYTFVRLRVDRVLAGISLALGRTDEERQEEALRLARKLVEKVEARLQE
jgi:hypothetical protein